MALGLIELEAAGGPADPTPVTSRSLPAERGVRSEAVTVLAAPAETVAQFLSDPKNFVPLFPAESIDIVSAEPTKKIIAVVMKKPFPIGTVRWVEDVVSSANDDAHRYQIDRTAHGGGYFRAMHARWLVEPTPEDPARCKVTYEVSMELNRWAPEWALRRGNLNGIVDTLSRLRKLIAERTATRP